MLRDQVEIETTRAMLGHHLDVLRERLGIRDREIVVRFVHEKDCAIRDLLPVLDIDAVPAEFFLFFWGQLKPTVPVDRAVFCKLFLPNFLEREQGFAGAVCAGSEIDHFFTHALRVPFVRPDNVSRTV